MISLSLVSKEYNKICRIKLNNLKDDYNFIENMLEKINYKNADDSNSYIHIKNNFNFINKYNFNAWYKYGTYIFPSRIKLDIPKNEKFKIKIYGKENNYKVIIKKKKKYRF